MEPWRPSLTPSKSRCSDGGSTARSCIGLSFYRRTHTFVAPCGRNFRNACGSCEDSSPATSNVIVDGSSDLCGLKRLRSSKTRGSRFTDCPLTLAGPLPYHLSCSNSGAPNCHLRAAMSSKSILSVKRSQSASVSECRRMGRLIRLQ